MIVRPTEILIGKTAIKEALGIGEQVLRQWIDQGAPICFRDGVYRAEKHELWLWVQQSSKVKIAEKQ